LKHFYVYCFGKILIESRGHSVQKSADFMQVEQLEILRNVDYFFLTSCKTSSVTSDKAVSCNSSRISTPTCKKQIDRADLTIFVITQ
jgi:hypothetical protein